MNLKEMSVYDIELLIKECRKELSKRKKHRKQEMKQLADELDKLLSKAHDLDINIIMSSSLDQVYFNLEYSEDIEILSWHN